MSGETKSSVSGWTIDTLKEYLERIVSDADRRYEQRFSGQSTAVDAAIRAASEATNKAERATELRFESVNEFRKTLGDQAVSFMTRAAFDEAQKAHQAYRDQTDAKINQLNTRLDRGDGSTSGRRDAIESGRANASIFIVGASALVSAVIALIAKYL